MIPSKFCSVTRYGECLSLRLNSEVWKVRPRPRRIVDPENKSKILDVSVISNVSVQDQISDIGSVQDFGWIRDLQNFFYAPFENNIWRMVEFTVKIAIVVRDIRRIVVSHIRSSILDWSMISNFQISRSVQWSLTSFQELRQFSGRDLSDLFRILFRSLIWIVLDFTGEICCVLRDIPRLIYCHILSSILDRSVISIFSEFLIRS